jgi:hypothetical protein
MFSNRLFQLLILAAILALTACAPQAEVISAATSVPAATLTPTTEPTVILTIAPTATAQPTKVPLPTIDISPFPAGNFFHQNNPNLYFTFSEGGRWGHFEVGTQFALATGRFSVDGNIYTQESNSAGCPVPMSFEYTFDGKNLTFQLTDQSNADTCGDRKDFYNDKVYILAP